MLCGAEPAGRNENASSKKDSVPTKALNGYLQHIQEARGYFKESILSSILFLWNKDNELPLTSLELRSSTGTRPGFCRLIKSRST